MRGDYRLIFLDIDGTLAGASGVIPARTLATLRRVRERGSEVVLCTGRSRTSTESVIEQIGRQGYGIMLNGSLLLNWDTGETLYRASLPLTTARLAAHVAHRCAMTPVCFGVCEDDRPIHTDRCFPLFPTYARLRRDRLVYLNDLETDLDAPPLSMAVYGAREEALRLAEAWRGQLDSGVCVYQGPTPHYRCWYAQITSDRADKALAAQALAVRLGIRREETLAIGDHTNDVGLLRWAGLGICMGDGDGEALACADHVTGTVDEEGAALALERFVLEEQGVGNRV